MHACMYAVEARVVGCIYVYMFDADNGCPRVGTGMYKAMTPLQHQTMSVRMKIHVSMSMFIIITIIIVILLLSSLKHLLLLLPSYP